jgi:acetyl esterase
VHGTWERWPQYLSLTENNGILIELHNNRGAMGYGVEAFRDSNPLAYVRSPPPKT